MKDLLLQEDIDIIEDSDDSDEEMNTSKIDFPEIPLSTQLLKRKNISKKNPGNGL